MFAEFRTAHRTTPRRPSRLALAAFMFLALGLGRPEPALFGQSNKDGASVETAAQAPTARRSQHFLVYTDLSEEESRGLLERLETMLALISVYWDRPCAGMIECYVVKDLANWPRDSLPEDGLRHIRAGAGVTVTTTIRSGNSRLSKAVVYAVADRGTPQHEAVHAYCGQTFGDTGPIWYAEGMAEMGQYWRKDDSSVQIHPEVLKYLKESDPKTLNEIVNAKEATGDSWQNYAWRWALCHLLSNNPNYAPRFRPLGVALLTGKPTSFESVYGDMANQISFEYLFFLEHLEQGYRADLCGWDWKKKLRRLENKATITAKVRADRGWQASGAILASGKSYQVKASGKWKTTKGGEAVDAKGHADGVGKLEGVLMLDMRLGEPFEIGAEGEFVAPADGGLYLRCRDGWGEIGDNEGQITVKLNVAGAIPPPKPKKKSDK